MVIPLLTKHSKDLGASPTVAGIIGSVYGFLQFFSSPLIGRWSDHQGRKFVLVFCLFTSSFSYLILGFSTNLFLAILGRLPSGIFKHSQEICKSYIADLMSEDDRTKIFGRFNSISSVGFIFGPIVGGYIVDINGGFHSVSLICASLFVFSFFIAYFFLPKIPKKTNIIQQRESKTLPINLSECNKKKDYIESNNEEVLSLKSFLNTFSKDTFLRFWEIILVKFFLSIGIVIYRFDLVSILGASKVGVLMSYSGLISGISGFTISFYLRFFKTDYNLLIFSALTQFICISSLAFTTNIYLLLLFSTPLSIANTIARVCCMNLMLSAGNENEIGALMGLGASVVSMSRFISPVLAGVSQEFLLEGPALLGSVSLIIGSLVLILNSKRFNEKYSKMKTI